MEKVANALEQRISSLSVKDSIDNGGAAHAQLLTSPSMDSLGGLGSTGAISPNPREDYLSDLDGASNDWHECLHPSELDSGDGLGSGVIQMSRTASSMTQQGRLASGSGQIGGSELGFAPNGSDPIIPIRESAFRGAAVQDVGSSQGPGAIPPVEETVIVGPGRTFHGLTRIGIERHNARRSALERIDPVGKWKEHRTLLIVWLVTAFITFIASLQWLQVGMWAGALGFVGPSFSVCHCCSDRKLPLNLQVTRIFAVSTSALSTFGAVLFVFLLIKLPCPHRLQSTPDCQVFRLALGLTALWHTFHALVSGLVSARASKILSQLEPLLTRKVLVVHNPNRSSPV